MRGSKVHPFIYGFKEFPQRFAKNVNSLSLKRSRKPSAENVYRNIISKKQKKKKMPKYKPKLKLRRGHLSE